LSVIKSLLALLQNDVVPLVPLRGSISASGDLCPLSYLAGALEGNPDVHVWTGPPTARKLITSDMALRQLKQAPVVFGPKETLGILNGTAISAAVATLAQHQADHLMILAQVLTAVGVEALLGRVESFDPFIADVRPHKGQMEVAQNITSFLRGSLLARAEEEEADIGEGHLRQDRYALRTASQWLGPYIEDLTLARQQLEVELNSTTDNPMFDVSNRKVHHAGNFQAVAITSSTEKTRLAVQMIGKIIFAQSTELLDVHQNNGLPPNLAADEPSLSYTLKGVDINMAAYMSELAFLANPVSSHVQSAEMTNQAVNSLALVSARYTHMALDVLSLMLSAYLYSLCQALDLRAMNARFIQQLKPAITDVTSNTFGSFIAPAKLDSLISSIWAAIEHVVSATTTKDSSDRFTAVAKSAHSILIDTLSDITAPKSLSLINSWTVKVATISKSLFVANRAAYLAHPDATPYLGAASKRMYQFVRRELQIPFHRGLVDHPTFHHTVEEQGRLKNTGSQISIIYEALRDERLVDPVMACMKDALKGDGGVLVAKL
jgi:phenylalanine ammonia-lyase